MNWNDLIIEPCGAAYFDYGDAKLYPSAYNRKHGMVVFNSGHITVYDATGVHHYPAKERE